MRIKVDSGVVYASEFNLSGFNFNKEFKAEFLGLWQALELDEIFLSLLVVDEREDTIAEIDHFFWMLERAVRESLVHLERFKKPVVAGLTDFILTISVRDEAVASRHFGEGASGFRLLAKKRAGETLAFERGVIFTPTPGNQLRLVMPVEALSICS